MAERHDDDMTTSSSTDPTTGRPERDPGQPGQQHSAGHGSSRAAWTAVAFIVVGCIIGALGVMFLDWWLGAIGAALVVAGPVVGKIMAARGGGQPLSFSHPGAEAEAAGRKKPGGDDPRD